MDTLDNANNPFAIPNKTNSDTIVTKNDEDLLLNITDGLKKNDDMPNNDLIKMLEKSNCERLTPEFDVDIDNLGPETDVDNPDDGSISPNVDVMKKQSETLNNNQKFNPFNDIETTLKMNWNLKDGAFDGPVTPSEESCPLPIEPVNNVSQLIDAGVESESEEDEEWNYVRGEEANKENIDPLQLNSQVAEEEEVEESDSMSQLNPNAAEFVPVSPVRPAASPLSRLIDEDTVLSQSPKKPPPQEADLNIPNAVDFEKDISQRPHELGEAISNGHQGDLGDEMPALNSSHKPDEFHFGPNAAPFTPVKLLDQSEASSTRAQYGDDDEDEEISALGASFDVSGFDQDRTRELTQKDDPMSMSFHQDRSADDSNPFDLNKVHMLPDDVDDFIGAVKPADSTNSFMNETISDLAEHFPLGKSEKSEEPKTITTTDLDLEEHKIETSSLPESNTCFLTEAKAVYDEERIEVCKTPVEEQRLQSPIDDARIPSPGLRTLSSPTEVKSQDLSELDRALSPLDHLAEERISNVEVHKAPSPFEAKEMVCSANEEKETCSPAEENMLLDLAEQEDSNFLAKKNDGEHLTFDPIRAEVEESVGFEFARPDSLVPDAVRISSTSCDDNIESPTASEEPITSELTPDNDEFAAFRESEKSDDRETAKEKEIEEQASQLAPLAADITTNHEECFMPTAPKLETNEPETSPNDFLVSFDVPQSAPQETSEHQQQSQLDQFVCIQEDHVISSTLPDQNRTITEEEEAKLEQPIDVESEPQPSLLDTSGRSVADTESVTTTDFLERSPLPEVESPLSPNDSRVSLEETIQQIVTVNDVFIPATITSGEAISEPAPVSTVIEPQLTPTLAAGRPASISLEQPAAKPTSDDKPSKAKETPDKKSAPKGKVTPSAGVRKTPAPRTSLGAAKPAASPSPRTATTSKAPATKPSPRLSGSGTASATKTEHSKTTSKSPAAQAPPRSGTAPARVPLSSRTKAPLTATKSSETNGDVKPAPKTTTASTGAVKKTTEGARSATATGTGRLASSTARAPLASARSATSTTATAAKPRPNTLKPAPSKTGTVAAPKSTSATTRTVTSTTARSTAAPKPSAPSAAGKDVKAPITKTFPKPKPAIDKQVKEVANKLTASRTVSRVTSTTSSSTLSKTSTTRKTEDKVSGTKTTTNRATTNSTATHHKPIKRPTEAAKTAATTKVGKPKENGIAPVVTEQIIINNSANQLNGITTNGDQQFVKDNSPVDNKLIVDSLTEAAAN